MGTSNSKKEKRPEKKIEEINQTKIENIEKEIKEEKINDNLNINVISTANNIKEEKNSNNNKNKNELLDDIEELTLENNKLLLNSKNQKIEIDIPNSQTETKNESTSPNKITTSIDFNKITIEKIEETIIIYSEKECQELIINFYEKMIDIIYNFHLRKNFINLVK